MANATMLQLPVASSVDGSEYAWIVQGGTDKRTTLQSIADLAVSGLVPTSRTINTAADSGLAGGGSLAADLFLSLDVENLVEKVTPTVADAIAMDNAVAGTPVKVYPDNFYKTISGLTAKAVPATSDLVVLYSIADSEARKATIGDLGIAFGNVPTGGTTGQPLIKLSATDYDIAWAALPVIGGGTGATTLTNHGVLLGQGTSAVVATAVMSNGQLLIGQTGADPAPTTVTGDVTISNLGVTAIGANKVTNGMLRQSAGLSVIGRAASSTGDVADITGAANQILRVDGAGATLGFGSIDLAQSAAVGSSVLGATNGGTGLSAYTLGDILYASAANTLSALAGNTTATKQYLSQTGNGAISAAPAWSTVDGGDITGAALTAGNDTNVTLTLGGTPATALLRAASITAGWTGQLSLARGGTNANLTASNGGIVYSDASALAILAGTATASLPLLSGSNTAPTWATIAYPGSATSGGIPYFSSTTAMASSALLAANQLVLGGGAGTAPATLGSLGTTTTVLHGNAAGAPTFGAVDLATDVTGTLPVPNGGTGAASFTAYAVLCGGTTSTGAFQNVSGVGTSGQVLTSNGAGMLPTWQSGGSGDVTGPASSTDNAAARFDSTTGKIIQDSALIIADTTGSLSRSGNGGIPVQGTNTNDSAAAGYVGEFVTCRATAESSTVTISNGSPAVVTWGGTALVAATDNYSVVRFTTTGTLPTGLSPGVNYYMVVTGGTTFNVASSVANAIAGTYINTSSAGSGTHTAIRNAILTSSNSSDIGGLSLTAGDWDVWVTGVLVPAATTTYTLLAIAANTVSATLPNLGSDGYVIQFISGTGLANFSFGTSSLRVSIASTTTIFGLVQLNFGVSTATGYGAISARRVR